MPAPSPTLETNTGAPERSIDVSNLLAVRLTDRLSRGLRDLSGVACRTTGAFTRRLDPTGHVRRDVAEDSSKERRENEVHENAPVPLEREPRDVPKSVAEEDKEEKHAPNTAEDQPQILEVEYVIENIVSHQEDPGGRVLGRVRWYSFQIADETIELIEHLPQSNVVRFYRRRKLESPCTLEKLKFGKRSFQ